MAGKQGESRWSVLYPLHISPNPTAWATLAPRYLRMRRQINLCLAPQIHIEPLAVSIAKPSSSLSPRPPRLSPAPIQRLQRMSPETHPRRNCSSRGRTDCGGRTVAGVDSFFDLNTFISRKFAGFARAIVGEVIEVQGKENSRLSRS